MSGRDNITNNIDWLTVILFMSIAVLGWLNIFAAVYDESANQSIFDMTLNSGRQLFFMASSIILIIAIMVVDFKFYDTFAYIIYGVVVFLLILVVFVAREISGANSWLEIGPLRLQPSEFAKFATALAVAKYMDSAGFRMDRLGKQIVLFIIIGVPAILIVAQGDTGTALVYSVFVLVFFREGMSPMLLILGVA
ncbi:MAG: rod shape-determining protein RodA, partial [Fulvivirga sp.]